MRSKRTTLLIRDHTIPLWRVILYGLAAGGNLVLGLFGSMALYATGCEHGMLGACTSVAGELWHAYWPDVPAELMVLVLAGMGILHLAERSIYGIASLRDKES